MASRRTGLRVCAFGIVCGMLQALPCLSQTRNAPTRTTVVVRAIGGFLGQLEGFCEDPGGRYDEQVSNIRPPACDGRADRAWPAWLGGALGANRWSAGLYRDPTTWLVIAPNNQTPDFAAAMARLVNPAARQPAAAVDAMRAQAVKRAEFWDQIRALSPDVVALGPVDFLRSLNPSSMSGGRPLAPAFIKWLQDSKIPFLASNVAVRITSNRLAITKGGPYELHVSRTSSISWLETLTLELPCDATPPISVIETTRNGGNATDNLAKGLAEVHTPCGETGRVDREIALTRALRPGRTYTVQVGGHTFTFRTDDALAPIAGESFAARDDGTVAVGVVDPGVADQLSTQARTWSRRDRCPDAACELVFLDPVKTVKAVVRARIAATGRPPVVVLASALSDGGTLDVLNAAPDVRIVVLPADSLLLGRAALPQKDRYSGDLGMAAVVDGDKPLATRLLVRPEWWGETAAEAVADVACTGDTCARALYDADASVTPVNGASFDHQTEPGSVNYYAGFGVNGSPSVDLGRYPAYKPCVVPAPDDACEDYVGVWDKARLPEVIADAVRRQAVAELAVVPKEIVDESYVDWIKKEMGYRRNTNWLSRYILERALFQSPRFVRAYIRGADLFGTLQSILHDTDHGGAYCVAGLRLGCPASLDGHHPERLEIQGRRVNQGLWYSVALPDDMAEHHKLIHDDRAVDATTAVDAQLTALTEQQMEPRKWPPGYVNFRTLELSYSTLTLRDPDGRSGVRKNLAIDSAGAKAAATLGWSVGADAALVDWTHAAIRVPGRVDYSRRSEPQPNANPEISYERDEFDIGARADWKTHFLGEGRIFGGYFLDGWFEPHQSTFYASRDVVGRDGFKTTEKTSTGTTYELAPRRFRGWRFGGDVLQVTNVRLPKAFSLNVKSLSANYTIGQTIGVPFGATINGEPQSADMLLAQGPAGALNDYFKRHPDAFATTVAFAPTQLTVDQQRLQLDGDVDLVRRVNGSDLTIASTLRFRHYRRDLGSPFALKQTTKATFKATTPLWRQLKVIPTYEFERARIEADDNNVFWTQRFEIRVAFPVVVKWGRGFFVR